MKQIQTSFNVFFFSFFETKPIWSKRWRNQRSSVEFTTSISVTTKPYQPKIYWWNLKKCYNFLHSINYYVALLLWNAYSFPANLYGDYILHCYIMHSSIPFSIIDHAIKSTEKQNNNTIIIMKKIHHSLRSYASTHTPLYCSLSTKRFSKIDATHSRSQVLVSLIITLFLRAYRIFRSRWPTAIHKLTN